MRRSPGLLLLAALGGCSTAANPTPDAAVPLDAAVPAGISQADIRRVAMRLAADDMEGRDEGSPGGLLARGFLKAEMERCGLRPAGTAGFEQPITGGKGVNLLGRVDGLDPKLKERFILLSAHYDHLGACGGKICNGADDNAAGVAIALAVACALAKEPTARSVLFAAWDAEEPPTFLTSKMGSEFFAGQPTIPLAAIDVAIALDLVGAGLWSKYKGHFLLGGEYSPEVSAALDQAPIPSGLAAFRAGLYLIEDTPLGHQPWSDYDAFRNLKRPVLFFANGQSKNYHEASDEYATLDLAKMDLEADYLLAIVRRLGELTQAPRFDGARRDHPRDVATAEAVLTAALAPGGLVDSVGLNGTSKAKLQSDLTKVKAVKAKLAGGGKLTPADEAVLQTGTQRIMCLAGSSYSENTCALF